MSQKRRKVFNVEEKSHIIFRLENGESNGEIAKELGVSHSTISSIWKNKDKIKALFEANSLNIKRSRSSEHKVIEEALLKWFKHQRVNNVPISGPILQQKANEFALLTGKENFKCSSSWIQRFRTRYNIAAVKVSGEAVGVSEGGTKEWLSHTWPTLCEGYKPEEIFNADETALYMYMSPDKALNLKDEQCKDGKLSKTRMTVLVTANMTGSRKQKLLVIGNDENPHCIQNIHSLPVTYENNASPWMTSQIFEKWLRNWDTQLTSEGNKILLLVDTRPAHAVVPNLKCIKLVFFPPNISSLLQPMEQGVIRTLKTQYKKLQDLKMLQNMENGENSKSLSILDAIITISEAWEQVTQSNIANCFRRAGFKDLSVLPEENLDDFLFERRIKSPTDEDDDVSLTQMDAQATIEPKIEVEEFIKIEENVAMCDPIGEEDILADFESNDEEDEDLEGQLPPPTLSEAINAISTLQRFVAFNEEFNSDIKQMLTKMTCKFQNIFENQGKKKQTKITDYFTD